MEVTQGQPTLKGLSQFLIQHEPCGVGFDVSHPAGVGSGKVSMTCRGCGTTYEYATATIEFEREVEFEPMTVRTIPFAPPPPPPPPPSAQLPQPEPPPPPTPSSKPEASAPPDTPSAEAQSSTVVPAGSKPPPASVDEGSPPPGPKKKSAPKNRSRDRAIAAVLLVLSALAMAFAVLRVTNQDDESEPAPPPTPSVVTPPPSQPSQTDNPTDEAPNATKPKPAEKEAPTATTPQSQGKVVKTARFSIVVPRSWQQSEGDGGVLLSPAGGSPISIQIFYENDPSMDRGDMESQTAAFLTSRDPKAKVGSPESTSVSGNPGFELNAVGPAGTQVALGVLADPYRYLAIESADPGTPESLRDQADKAMETFKPR